MCCNSAGWYSQKQQNLGLYRPMRAKSLSSLSPNFIVVEAGKPFKEEAHAYSERVHDWSGSVVTHVWPRAYHAFKSIAPEANLPSIDPIVLLFDSFLYIKSICLSDEPETTNCLDIILDYSAKIYHTPKEKPYILIQKTHMR